MKIKLIILLCFVIAISSSSRAQKIKLNDVVSFEIPALSQKLTSATKVEYARAKNIKLIPFPEVPERSSYVFDNSIITLSVSKQKQKVSLTNIEKSQHVEGQKDGGFIVKRLTINGNSFITSLNPTDNKIWLFGTDKSGMTLVIGVLEFTDIYKANSDLIIDKVLKGISYNY